MTLVTDWLI